MNADKNLNLALLWRSVGALRVAEAFGHCRSPVDMERVGGFRCFEPFLGRQDVGVVQRVAGG